MSADAARCWAVLPAAGTGSRMGGELPKQYLQVAGATLLEHSLQALLDCAQISAVVVALQAGDKRAATLSLFQDPRVHTVIGAQQRSGSVLAGLERLRSMADSRDWVLVHDAARPCLQADDIQRLIATVTASGMGGILAEAIVDTVKEAAQDAAQDAMVLRTLDRATLWRAQTPQMFRLEELWRAMTQARQRGEAVTDEAGAMELAGHPVQLIAASAGNFKVTVPADLPLAAWYLQARAGRASA